MAIGKRFVFLYGFNNAHELRDVKFMIDGDITVRKTQGWLSSMTFRNPDVTEIYAMDGSWELSWELTNAYKDLCRNQNKDFTQILIFYDYVSRQGLRLK